MSARALACRQQAMKLLSNWGIRPTHMSSKLLLGVVELGDILRHTHIAARHTRTRTHVRPMSDGGAGARTGGRRILCRRLRALDAQRSRWAVRIGRSHVSDMGTVSPS